MGAGFTLVQAIFIIVVLGLLGTFMVTMLGVQSRTTTLSHQGIRAYYAAQSGLEWGKNYTLENDACFNATTFSPVNNFEVTLNCTSETYTEASDNVRWFRLNATAEYDVDPDSPDYVRRSVSVQMLNASN